MDKVNTELTKSTLPGIASSALDSSLSQPTFNQLRERLEIHISFIHERHD
jgi:hypothetical protein